MGMVLALCSVLIVSGAQLLLRWSMLQLPLVTDRQFLNALLVCSPASLGILGGLLAYGLSMLCWFFALKRLPLSIAYPLLSLSYVLVWSGAVWLPALNESFHWGKLAGVLLIMLGLLLICWRGKSARSG
ncbi:4-amino-4-deoxy-L-arabinose-phosphoundecaprenol flippase subunit ArnF [Enterobacteriaceae bacterium LUAb1]